KAQYSWFWKQGQRFDSLKSPPRLVVRIGTCCPHQQRSTKVRTAECDPFSLRNYRRFPPIKNRDNPRLRSTRPMNVTKQERSGSDGWLVPNPVGVQGFGIIPLPA